MSLGDRFDNEYELDNRTLDDLLSERPRLKSARKFFLCQKNLDLEGLLRFYRGWRDLNEYGVMQRLDDDGIGRKKEFIAVKCSKRGNDVYQSRIRNRFGLIERFGKDVEFFSFHEDRPIVSVLFVTLTWRGVGSLSESWENNGIMFNRWINNLRWKYGALSYVRSWEATERGYAHVHLMILFHEARFHGFKTINDEGELVWRIEEKSEFEKGWPFFIDVRAPRSWGAVVRYIKKRALYGTDKADDADIGDRTLALMFLFRKRSFALSIDLLAKLGDLIASLHNSKLDQAKLLEGFVKKWAWIGVYTADELGLDGSEWAAELKDPPYYERKEGYS